MRYLKGIALLAGLSWLVRLEWLSSQHRAMEAASQRDCERRISEHRETSPHGIALIGSPPSLELDELSLGGTLSSESPISPYFGLPIRVVGTDPEAFIRGASA